ncbi:hypothetical protein DAPPUDRAFT_117997 [Daphnia pulex]|uniref:Uncharacterized protein n=1 Tax=Daphnia pulex TaxID=6669 RepID=E9HUD5_DAPPU|nr:hypothetical protein DAPPUDRAFT_117997 [Daphnia pulex]|eukprot:EFX64643.1 hypothetical protein DAPPUDRAFT_117997 [Daphnia pulex]
MSSLNDSYVRSSRRGYRVGLTTKIDCSAKKFLCCVLANSRSLLKNQTVIQQHIIKSDLLAITETRLTPENGMRSLDLSALLHFSQHSDTRENVWWSGCHPLRYNLCTFDSSESSSSHFLKAGSSLPPVQLNRPPKVRKRKKKTTNVQSIVADPAVVKEDFDEKLLVEEEPPNPNQDPAVPAEEDVELMYIEGRADCSGSKFNFGILRLKFVRQITSKYYEGRGMSKQNTTGKPDLYQQLYQGYSEVHSDLTRQQCQKEFNKKWKTIKECKNRSEEAEKYLKELKGAITLKRHSPGSIVNLLAKVLAKASTAQSADAASSKESKNNQDHPVIQKGKPEAIHNSSTNSSNLSAGSTSAKTPAQDAIKAKLEVINSDSVALYKRRDADMLNHDEEIVFKKKKEERTKLKNKLRVLQNRQKLIKKLRDNRAAVLKSASSEFKDKLKLRNRVGKPRAILNIAMHGSAAQEKRRNEIYRSILTLDDLNAPLIRDGFHVTRSSVYLRLKIRNEAIVRKESAMLNRCQYNLYAPKMICTKVIPIKVFAKLHSTIWSSSLLFMGHLKSSFFLKMIKPVDGEPDENQRYQKNFDAVFVVTNASSRSSFNRVERRMAPLSRELAGLILQHDHYGSHLDNSGKTTDDELEKKNFEHTGSTLAKVWNSVIVDGHPIVAEHIDPLTSELNDELHLNIADQNWFSEHVRISQYFLQIVKCNNLSCCTAPRSSYFSIVPSRFLPDPVPLCQTLESGLRAT